MAQPNDITVFITTGDATCAECGEDLGRHACDKYTQDTPWPNPTPSPLFIPTGDATCADCGEDPGRPRRASWIESRSSAAPGLRRPKCPSAGELVIAGALRSTRPVGRGARLDRLHLAVLAHVRHAETNYDALLTHGYDRSDARAEVERTVNRVLDKWQSGH